jgi:hypothetical protein
VKHAVAGDSYGEGVRRARAADRAGGSGGADPAGDFGVGGRLAGGDAADDLPDPLLEGGASHVERQVQAARGGLDESDHLRQVRLETALVPDEEQPRKEHPELFCDLVRVIADQDRHHALCGARDQDRPERRCPRAETDFFSRTMGAGGHR